MYSLGATKQIQIRCQILEYLLLHYASILPCAVSIGFINTKLYTQTCRHFFDFIILRLTPS